jgi:hypothetical protein
MVYKAWLDSKDIPVKPPELAPQAPQANKEQLVLLGILVQLVLRAQMGLRAFPVREVSLEHAEIRVRKVLLALRVPRALKAPQVHVVLKVIPEQWAQLVILDKKAQLAQPVTKDQLD